MTGHPTSGRAPVPPRADADEQPERHEHQPFLNTYRAVAACAREFARLTDEVLEGVTALADHGILDKPVVRQSPDRCIIQLGPVALTLAWLRGPQDSIATGELLVVVWRGSVAKRPVQSPERAHVNPAGMTATELWTEVFAAEATDEASWLWRAAATGEESWPSSRLAAHVVGRLQLAHGDSVLA